MYEITPLKKRSKYCYADIKKENKIIYLSFFKVNIIDITPLAKDQGYSFIIKVPENDYSYKMINDIEEYTVKQIINNNNSWFNNDLNEDNIRKSFKSSISGGGNIKVYYSTHRPPDSNNGEIIDFDKLYNDNKHSNLSIHCKIKCEGIYIYPTKFLLRWIITSIDEDSDTGDVMIDDGEIKEIKEHWEKEYNSYIGKLDEYSTKCKTMLNEYENIKKNVTGLFEQINKCENINEFDINIKKFNDFIMSYDENKNLFF